MNDRLLRAYHKLPTASQSVAASLWGVYLRSWRYGADTDRMVAEAHAREQYSPDRWRAYREGRLAEALHKAATEVPYYRELWSRRRQRGDRRSWERLEHWPEVLHASSPIPQLLGSTPAARQAILERHSPSHPEEVGRLAQECVHGSGLQRDVPSAPAFVSPEKQHSPRL